jgi:voltage-gated sodium channel
MVPVIMTEFCRTVTTSALFQRFIIAVILLAGLVVGLETFPEVERAWGPVLHGLDQSVLWIFALEIVLKIGAHGRHPLRFFREGWNVFDFVIVVVCFLPLHAEYVAVLRLARILRVLRLVSVLPRLQLLVGALLKSIPSMGYVGLLLFLLFYIYAVTGVKLFAGNDPVHFGNLGAALLTLFQVVTLEGWTEFLLIQMNGSHVHPIPGWEGPGPDPKAMPVVAVVYFVSFILLGTMIMLNLFIGVIMNGMQETEQEMLQSTKAESREELLDGIERDLAEIQKRVACLRRDNKP